MTTARHLIFRTGAIGLATFDVRLPLPTPANTRTPRAAPTTPTPRKGNSGAYGATPRRPPGQRPPRAIGPRVTTTYSERAQPGAAALLGG